MKKLIFILLIFLIYISNSAQEINLHFENISTLSGLSATTAKCIFQDSEGYLWIGTMGGGLNRYDGYSFTVFKHNEEDSTSIIHNNVYGLAEDNSGDIWIATMGGDIKVHKK